MTQNSVHQPAEYAERSQAPGLYPNMEAFLIEAAQEGNLEAFNRLVLAYQDSLYGWISSLVRDEDLAEDITQMAFITAYEKLSTLRGGSFRSWLFKIARNRAFDELRYSKRRPAVSLDEDLNDEDDRSLLSFLPATGPSPEEALIQREREDWVRSALNSLPEASRQAVELIDLYEMDYQEAADVLGVPVGTVKSRVARARVKLYEKMSDIMASESRIAKAS